jgi:hypothetical protein
LRAATLAAQAERCWPILPILQRNDKVRIDGAARRSFLDMQSTLQPAKQRKEENLDQHVQRSYGRAVRASAVRVPHNPFRHLRGLGHFKMQD